MIPGDRREIKEPVPVAEEVEASAVLEASARSLAEKREVLGA